MVDEVFTRQDLDPPLVVPNPQARSCSLLRGNAGLRAGAAPDDPGRGK